MKKTGKLFKYIFLSVASFISIFPFFWMIIGATNTSKEISIGKLTFGTHLIENIRSVFEQTNVERVFLNSIIISSVSTILAILLASMAGYAFEVFKTKFLDKVFNIIMLSMMIPFAAVMIPLFRMMSQIGLLDTYAGVMLPTLVTAFLIFFFRQNTKSFPKELIEAARVDGLGEVRIFFRIFVPSMKATYAAAGIITFMASWNNYLWPLIAIQTNEQQTLPLLISYVASAYQPNYGAIMVLIIIATLPTLIVFFLMQKYFVEGMVGSIK
ncbi:MAG: carbohydrate ABC transporter permease [Clostridiaceae bacterium]